MRILLTTSLVVLLGVAGVSTFADDEVAGDSNFQPQSAREKQIYDLLQATRKELSELKREAALLRGKQGDHEPQVSDSAIAKHKKAFETYDKDGDGSISFQERLAMRNYEVTGSRLLNEKLYHLADDANFDSGVSLREFAAARERTKASRWNTARLIEVNAKEGAIKVQVGQGDSGEPLILRVAPKAIIAVKGVEAQLADLTAGQPVFVFMANDQQYVIGLTQR